MEVKLEEEKMEYAPFDCTCLNLSQWLFYIIILALQKPTFITKAYINCLSDSPKVPSYKVMPTNLFDRLTSLSIWLMCMLVQVFQSVPCRPKGTRGSGGSLISSMSCLRNFLPVAHLNSMPSSSVCLRTGAKSGSLSGPVSTCSKVGQLNSGSLSEPVATSSKVSQWVNMSLAAVSLVRQTVGNWVDLSLLAVKLVTVCTGISAVKWVSQTVGHWVDLSLHAAKWVKNSGSLSESFGYLQ